jgi:hypothetical protein
MVGREAGHFFAASSSPLTSRVLQGVKYSYQLNQVIAHYVD